MISILLRERMQEYTRRTGQPLTYVALAARTGLSVETIQSIAVRRNYNTRLTTIEKICVALECSPGELLKIEAQQAGRRAGR